MLDKIQKHMLHQDVIDEFKGAGGSAASNSYEWTTTEGQLVYTLPTNTTYNPNTKWLEVIVGGAPMPPSYVQKDSSTQFTLLVNASDIPAGVKVVARWVEPFIAATAGHKTVHEIGGNDELDIMKLKNFQEQVITPLADNAKKLSGFVNVKEYGAKTIEEDPLFDNTTAIQNAANAAKDLNVPIYLNGRYLIKNALNLKCGIEGKGTFVVDSTLTTPIITFDKTTTSETVSLTGLTGLTQGSWKITGLAGKKGYVGLLSSPDIMIERTGGQDAYYKRDAFKILSDEGDLSCPLDCTYGSNATFTIYPNEKPITIDNLKIEIQNINANSNALLEIKRSNVTFRSLTVENYSANQLQFVVNLSETVNVNFYNLSINGAMFYEPNPGIGYGVNIWNSAHITLNESFITNCRHSTSGRHAKDVKIIGGVHGNSIDCHWGADWKIRDCTINVQKTYKTFTNYQAVLYCGSNISVENCTVYGAKLFFGVRDDTPELRGSVIIENNKWYPDLENDYCWYGFSIGDNTSTYSHTIVNPDVISIENNKMFAPLLNGTTPSYVKYYSNGYNRTYPTTKIKEIRIENNYHGDVVAKFLEIRKSTARYTDNTVTKVTIKGMEANSNKIDLQFANQETYPNIQIHDYTSGYVNVDRDLYDIYMSDVRNVNMYIDATTIRKGFFDNVTFCYRIHRKNITQDGSLNYLQPTDCNYKFNRCEFLYYSNHNGGTEQFWFRMDITNVFITNTVYRCNMSFDNTRHGVGAHNSVVYYTNNNMKVAGKTFTGTMNGLVNAMYATT